jgi:hypothetical protein
MYTEVGAKTSDMAINPVPVSEKSPDGLGDPFELNIPDKLNPYLLLAVKAEVKTGLGGKVFEGLNVSVAQMRYSAQAVISLYGMSVEQVKTVRGQSSTTPVVFVNQSEWSVGRVVSIKQS